MIDHAFGAGCDQEGLCRDAAPVPQRLRRQRTIEIKDAKARIWLACETLGPHMAVRVSNDALREQLDRLGEEGC
jgi:hypothetical protein